MSEEWDKRNVEDVLKDLGWGDGFHIPVANEENRALELEIQKKQKEKDNLRSSLEDVNDRLSAMKKHLANVQSELSENQNMIMLQQNQIKTEENLVKSARVEDSSLGNDIRRMKKECDDINSRQGTLQADINRVNAKLEKLKSAAKWDQDALLAWDEEVSRGHDDMIMLERFTKEDEIRFNEMELRRQNLRMELESKRHKVNNAKNDLLCMEQSLEKTAQLFRQQHGERRAMVRQWEASVRILHQRDEDINRSTEEIGNLKVLAKRRLKDLSEQKAFYETQMANNRELDKDIAALGLASSEGREQLRILSINVTELNGNLLTVQNILDKCASDLRGVRNKKKEVISNTEKKIAQTEEEREKLSNALEDLERMQSENLTTAERVKRLEEMSKDEEKMLKKLLNDDKKLGELAFQVAEQLRELREGEKLQTTSIDNIESNINLIKKHKAKTETELNRQKEIMYNMDFQYMEKDIQLNRLLGIARRDDTEKYEKKIAELEDVHAQFVAKNSFLSKEVGRLEEERRRLTVDMEIDSKELENLKNKRQNNILLTEGGLKQLKTMRQRNQEKQVEENLLKLRVKQAEKAINLVGGKVFSLEKQRLEMEEAMKEREVEIKALRDILNVRRRILNEEASDLRTRIRHRKTMVDIMKKKYDVTVGKLGTDSDGQPLSVTHFKIKTAQERFELQEMGDKLDAKIKMTEKEITAMENTLKVVNASNKAFKNNLQSVGANSPEEMEKEELERSLVREMEELRKQKALLEEVNRETNRLEEIYNAQLRKEEEIVNSWKEKKELMAQLEKEVNEQEDKLNRAEKQLRKSVKEIRGTLCPKFMTVEEKDIELRELLEQNQSVLQQCAELVAKTVDTGPVVARYLSEKGIHLPSVRSPSESVRYASSTASLPSPCGKASASSRSASDSPTARSSSSCMLSPSVITLDSAQLLTGECGRCEESQRDASPRQSLGILPRAKSSVRFSGVSMDTQ